MKLHIHRFHYERYGFNLERFCRCGDTLTIPWQFTKRDRWDCRHRHWGHFERVEAIGPDHSALARCYHCGEEARVHYAVDANA